jgi:hypothetical protein
MKEQTVRKHRIQISPALRLFEPAPLLFSTTICPTPLICPLLQSKKTEKLPEWNGKKPFL